MIFSIAEESRVFHWSLSCKESTCNEGDSGLIPGLAKSPGEGNGYSLQYSCLGNPMDRGVWRAPVHGVTKSRTQLSMHTHNALYGSEFIRLNSVPLYVHTTFCSSIQLLINMSCFQLCELCECES